MLLYPQTSDKIFDARQKAADDNPPAARKNSLKSDKKILFPLFFPKVNQTNPV